MAKVSITQSKLDTLAGKIATKSGQATPLTLDEMGTAVDGIATRSLLKGIMRPDASLVYTWTYDKMMKEDESVNPISYTTTSTTMIDSASLSHTETLDLTDYDYYVAIRMATIPTYSITTKGKGREEYAINGAFYEITRTPASTMHALIDTTKYYTSAANVVYQGGNFAREVYYSSSSAISYYGSAAYGYNQTVAAPSVSSSSAASPTLTVKSPKFIARGNTSYFVNTYMNAVTDVRYQYIIELWRAKKGDLNLDGWGLTQQWLKMCDDVLNNNGTIS